MYPLNFYLQYSELVCAEQQDFILHISVIIELPTGIIIKKKTSLGFKIRI